MNVHENQDLVSILSKPSLTWFAQFELDRSLKSENQKVKAKVNIVLPFKPRQVGKVGPLCCLGVSVRASKKQKFKVGVELV